MVWIGLRDNMLEVGVCHFAHGFVLGAGGLKSRKQGPRKGFGAGSLRHLFGSGVLVEPAADVAGEE
jgi:hypothetical protein